MDASLPLVSVVCPALADAEALCRFHGDMYRVLRPLEDSYRFEIVYQGGPGDAGAVSQLESLAQLDPRVRVLPSAPAGGFDALARAGIQSAAGSMLIVVDPLLHPADLIATLLERARDAVDIVIGAFQEVSRPTGLWKLLGFDKRPLPRMPILLKRVAVEAVMTSRRPRQSLESAARANGFSIGEVPFTPRVATRVAPNPTIAFSWPGAGLEPLVLVGHFGALVFYVGLFLAVWFTLQGLIWPNSVWFSWCCLIVVLHILGGAALFALGRVGALCQRIEKQLKERKTDAPMNGAEVGHDIVHNAGRHRLEEVLPTL